MEPILDEFGATIEEYDKSPPILDLDLILGSKNPPSPFLTINTPLIGDKACACCLQDNIRKTHTIPSNHTIFQNMEPLLIANILSKCDSKTLAALYNTCAQLRDTLETCDYVGHCKDCDAPLLVSRLDGDEKTCL